jgi:tRNA A-37 threonylcarbamoyl transferase component Bud32
VHPGLDRRFVVGERVGVGATAEVLRAHDTARGVSVAIKRLHEHLASDPSSRERFAREARICARISSEHVVRYVASGVDEEERPYLVLEWLEGEDLGRRLRAGRMPPEESLEVARQAALGLAALHAAGVIHRDVKPSNLFLARAGGRVVVKLIDLGVARELAGSARGDGIALGTPFYASPEQARGEAEIGPLTDLFSLGVVLFELLTGRRPFVGEDGFAVLTRIALQAPPRLEEAWPEAPAVLRAAVSRAMARSPAARFKSAKDMARALGAAQRGEGGALPVPEPVRAVAVLFARLPAAGDVERARAMFRRMAAEHGGEVYALLGRGMAAVFDAAGSEDGLDQAAGVALALASVLSGVRLALATGAARADGLEADLVERATRVISRPSVEGEAAVRLTDEAAERLASRFVVEGEAGMRSLRAARI